MGACAVVAIKKLAGMVHSGDDSDSLTHRQSLPMGLIG